MIRSINKNSDHSDEKCMKIKFNLDDKLPLNKTKDVSSIIIVVRAIFLGNDIYYRKVFLDECLYKL